jgi:small subunit ribosomal protein S16
MLKIRLSRGGRTGVPFYRILVTNSTSPRDSKFLEKVGTYNPLVSDDEKKLSINKERVEYWLSVGAQPTERVASFLIKLGVKGSEAYKPKFQPKNKGSNLKKKALEKAKKEAERLAEIENAKNAETAVAESQ